jgi:hypothetical protein
VLTNSVIHEILYVLEVNMKAFIVLIALIAASQMIRPDDTDFPPTHSRGGAHIRVVAE